jgi:hypothetical protein
MFCICLYGVRGAAIIIYHYKYTVCKMPDDVLMIRTSWVDISSK